MRAKAEAIDVDALDKRRAHTFWEYRFIWWTANSLDPAALAMASALRDFDASMGYVLRPIARHPGRFAKIKGFATVIDVRRGRSFHKGIFGERVLEDEERWQCIAIAEAIRRRDEHEGLFVDFVEAAHVARA